MGHFSLLSTGNKTSQIIESESLPACAGWYLETKEISLRPYLLPERFRLKRPCGDAFQ